NRIFGVGAAISLLSGVLAFGALPARAEPLVSASDVSAGITAPSSANTSFDVTATIKNTGAFNQPAGSKLTISASGGSVTAAPGCTLTAGAAVCTAGALSPGQVQSFGATVTVAPNASSVTTTATVQAANGELNLTPDTANNTATAVTNVVYSVDAALSSSPSTVRNGTDTLLTATVNNAASPQNVTVSVATGNTYDPALALPAGCTANGSGSTVTCTHAYSAGQTRSFDIAVTTPASGDSITSVATATGAAGGSDSASAVTNMSPDATAFVPAGKNLASANPHSNQTFYVTSGSAPGLPLDLNEVSLPAGTMCGPAACETFSVQALFPNSGTYSGSDPAHPFLWDLSYGKLTCNGIGAPKCTDVLYYIPSGGPAPIKLEKCQSFGLATPVLRTVDEICLQNAVKSGGSWTFSIALLRDIEIPIIGGTKV
ncbi:MAG TPA: hypothetical protein VMZ22_00970, partial [Acidimicrobiales bacterium]|nr:hypothetical protein [Acidimicrobiales bacterium]